jgi:Tfp pilus assembly protein PilE
VLDLSLRAHVRGFAVVVVVVVVAVVVVLAQMHITCVFEK